MDRDALRATVHDGGITPVDGRCGMIATASARRLARHAWLVRTAAVAFLVGGGVVSYLLFSAA
jgi:hypothetical protein